MDKDYIEHQAVADEAANETPEVPSDASEASEKSSGKRGHRRNPKSRHFSQKWKTVPARFLNAGAGTSSKTNRILLFLANLIVMMPFILRHRYLHFAIVALVFTLVELLVLVLGRKEKPCATAYLPLCLFFDALLLLLSFALPKLLLGLHRTAAISLGLSAPALIAAIVGLALFFFKNWLSNLGLAVFDLAASYGILGGVLRFLPQLSAGVKPLLFAVFLSVLLWTFLCYLAKVGQKNTEKLNKWLGFLLSLALLFTEYFWSVELLYRAGEIGTWLFHLITEGLAWRATIFSAIFLLILAACAFNYRRICFTEDAEVYTILGFGILLAKIASGFYSQLSWVIVPLFCYFSLSALHSDDNRMFGLILPVYYPFLFIACALAAWALCAGLFWMLVVSIFSAVFLSSSWAEKGDNSRPMAKWSMLLVLILLEGASFSIIKRFSLSMLFMLLTVFLSSLAAMVAVNLRVKKERNRMEGKFNLIICLVCVMLTAVAILPRGVRMRIIPDTEKGIPNTVTVEISANRKSNAVTEVDYLWADSFFTPNNSENSGRRSGSSDGFTSTIDGSHLVIRAVNETGLRQENHYWVPLGLAAWLVTE